MNLVDAVSLAQRYTVPALGRSGGEVESAAAQSQSVAAAVFGYVSPRLRFDREIERLVIEIRDIQNGEIQQSYPAKTTVEAYQRAARTGIPGLGVPSDFVRPAQPAEVREEAPKPKPEPVVVATGGPVSAKTAA